MMEPQVELEMMFQVGLELLSEEKAKTVPSGVGIPASEEKANADC